MGTERNISVLLGDPKSAIRTMMVPFLFSLVVTEINSFADRSWCSGLGPDALAATAVVLPIYLVIGGLSSGLGVGAAAVVSRFIGASDKATAEGCAKQSVLFAVLFSAAVTPLLLLSMDGILSIIGSPDINGLAAEYMFPICLFTAVFILNGTISGLLRGEGAARLAMYMVVLTAAVNVVLDPILIYVLDMGISGAAYATVIATGLSTAFGTVLYLTGNTYIRLLSGGMRPSWPQMSKVLQVGVPQMLEYSIMYAMNIVLNYLVLYCAGSYGLTVYSVPNEVLNFAIIPAMAIGSAMIPVASSAYGQRNMERVQAAYRYSLKLSLLITTSVCIIVFIFPNQFLYPFTYSPDTLPFRADMAEAMRIYCLYIPFFALIPLGSSLLQSITMPNRSVICALVRNIILIVLYIIAAQYSLYWIFWAVVLGEAIGGLMMYFVAGWSFRKVSGARPNV